MKKFRSTSTIAWTLGLMLCTQSSSLTAGQDSLDGRAPADSTSQSRSIGALGRLEPEHGVIRLAAPAMIGVTAGVVLSELLVEEGETVSAGQLLAVTDLSELMQALIGEAEADLALAERQAEAAANAAEASCALVESREREALRREQWRESSVASEEEWDRARAEAQSTRLACIAARSETEAAQARIAVAEAGLARARADHARTRIVAPHDGEILEVLVRPGELITPEGALELGRVERMYAIAEVYETDIRHVRPGHSAVISSPALEVELTGRVEYIRRKVRKQDEIGTDPAARKDARIVEVEILLDDPEPVKGLTFLQVSVIISP